MSLGFSGLARRAARATAFICGQTLCLALGSPVEEALPPLRPPRPELPPGFWEQNGFWVVGGAVVALTVLAALGLLLARPRQPTVIPPAYRARTELQKLSLQTGAVEWLSQVSQTVKGYFQATFGLPPFELTTAEFCRELARHARVGSELEGAVTVFLRACDERKFAPHPLNGSFTAVAEALRLVDAGEARLAELQRAEEKVRPG